MKKKYKFKCPECEWGCNDPSNKSGIITRHFKDVHGLNIEEVVKKHPSLKLKVSIRRKRKLDSDIECKVCGKKMKKISNTHLKKHGMTPTEYKEKYNVRSTAGRGTSKKQRVVSIQSQVDKIFNGNRLPNSIIPLFSKNDYTGVESKYEFKCNKCSNIFEDHLDDGNIPICKVCNPNKDFSPNGKAQLEIYNFINSYEYNIILNDRSVIGPKELDFYVPDLKIGIEYNGLYWHSERFKDKHYHVDKLNLCTDSGIDLIQIFEDEWIYKTDIVKSKLEYMLGKSPVKVYARKCTIKKISKKASDAFLNNNHLQGADIHSVAYGLFYKSSLISVMTFCKPRLPLGQKNSTGKYELSRFCSKLNHSVVGGASKLFKYFIREYNPHMVYTYADRRWTPPSSNFYETIGFVKDGITPVGYWYYKPGQYKRHHRFRFRKDVVVRELGGDPKKTEWQNMQEFGFDRIWDCGNYKYTWKSI